MIYILASSQPACDRLKDRCTGECKTFLIKDKTSLKPFLKTEKASVFIISGARLLKRFGEEERVPKNRAVGSMRQKEHVFDNKSWFFTFDPYLANMDHQVGVELDLDIKLAERLADTGTVKPNIGEYEYVDDFTEAIEYLKSQKTPTATGCDLETVRLNPYDDSAWIVSISLSVQEGFSQVIYFDGVDGQPEEGSLVWDQIQWLLNSPKVKITGANFKYDISWIVEKWNIHCTNFTMDTTLVGSLLDENTSNSLNIHAKRFTTMGGYDDMFNMTFDKGKMNEVPKDDLLPYAGGDTDAVLQVAKVFKKKLAKDSMLARFYVKLLHPAVRAFETVEQEGILIDLPYYFKLKDELEAEIENLEQEALKLISPFIRNKYHGIDSKGLHNLRLSRPAVIKDFMFGPRGLNLTPKIYTPKSTKEKPVPSTAFEHLIMFADNPKAKRFIAILKKSNSAGKTLSTYVDGFLKHLCTDGRFHPSFNFFKGQGHAGKEGGTVTGRASAVGPAVQCVTADTLFLTDRGPIPTLDVKIGQRVISHTGKVQTVTDFVDNGVHDILKVVTASGLFLRTNKSHPYMVSSGDWLQAKDLEVGDTVVTACEAEAWRPIEDYPEYEVSDWGRVRSLRYGKLKYLKLTNVGFGHLRVWLHKGQGEQVTHTVHSLVAKAWVDGYAPGREVRHKNGIPWVNLASNLVWGDQGDNGKDMALHGTQHGENNPGSKLTWEQVDYILKSPKTGKCLAKALGVSKATISRVRNGTHWVKKEYAPQTVKFTESKITAIIAEAPEPTYGITISEDHSHVTNGIITHNTVPKHTAWAKPLRKGYIAPPGFSIVNWDFSQGELRIAADVSGEETMLRMYKEGYDQHLVTGGRMLGYSISDMMEMKEKDPDLFAIIRQNGKAGNFGLLYGMSAKGFRDYARVTFGVIMTLEEAEQKRDAFFDLYPRLVTWHEEQKDTAYKMGYVRNPLGRIRHLPMIYSNDNATRSKAQRQAINSPVQSTLSDITIYSLALIHAKYGVQPTCRFHCFTHDSLTSYVRNDKIGYWNQRVTKIMENLPLEKEFGWLPRVKFVSDCEVGPTWASTVPYKDWLIQNKNKIEFTA